MNVYYQPGLQFPARDEAEAEAWKDKGKGGGKDGKGDHNRALNAARAKKAASPSSVGLGCRAMAPGGRGG